MADQKPRQRLDPSVARGPYRTTPEMDPAQAAQELAHLESSPRNPNDRIQQAEMAALRRISSGNVVSSHKP